MKSKVFIIAEAGVNHNGCKKRAFDLIDAAAEAGADAIKFQTFQAAKLASTKAKKASYQKVNSGDEESQLAMLSKLELPYAWHADLKKHAQQVGIEFLSTAFDQESLAFLQTLDLPLYKIPSGEISNAPLLWHFAKTGKPLILSTGMASLSEIELAVAIIHYALNHQDEPRKLREVWQYWSQQEARHKLNNTLTLLHCTSQYPTPWSAVNLKAITTLAQTFQLPVGYSDHTLGTLIPVAAVALGAKVIEKHVTLDKQLPGPDHQASLNKEELIEMVTQIRATEEALGSGIKTPQPNEWEIRKVARQSLIAARPIKADTQLQAEDFTTARTEGGLPPYLYWDLLGTVSKKAYQEGEPLKQ